MSFIIDSSKKGLSMVLREYEELALKYVWMNPEKGVSSRETHMHVNKNLGETQTISRASIINFLNRMVDENTLSYKERTTKGGMKRVYFPKLDEKGFKLLISKSIITNLLRDFPEETQQALKDLGILPAQ
jgi:predicted transcriptional regulator